MIFNFYTIRIIVIQMQNEKKIQQTLLNDFLKFMFSASCTLYMFVYGLHKSIYTRYLCSNICVTTFNTYVFIQSNFHVLFNTKSKNIYKYSISFGSQKLNFFRSFLLKKIRYCLDKFSITLRLIHQVCFCWRV